VSGGMTTVHCLGPNPAWRTGAHYDVTIAAACGGDVNGPRLAKSAQAPLNVDHVHAGLHGRLSHSSVEGQDVRCSPRERQCDVRGIECAQRQRVRGEQQAFRLPMHRRVQMQSRQRTRLGIGEQRTADLVQLHVMPRSLDVDCHAHPRMNAALKKMFAPRQTRDLQLAALKDTSPGHRDVLKAAGTLGNRRLSCVERR